MESSRVSKTVFEVSKKNFFTRSFRRGIRESKVSRSSVRRAEGAAPSSTILPSRRCTVPTTGFA